MQAQTKHNNVCTITYQLYKNLLTICNLRSYNFSTSLHGFNNGNNFCCWITNNNVFMITAGGQDVIAYDGHVQLFPPHWYSWIFCCYRQFAFCYFLSALLLVLREAGSLFQLVTISEDCREEHLQELIRCITHYINIEIGTVDIFFYKDLNSPSHFLDSCWWYVIIVDVVITR